MHVISYSKNDLDRVAKKLSTLADGCEVFTFTGPLGAGKTTLVGCILAHLGVTQAVTSPTFTYMQVYTTADGKKVYHFDLYRIDSIDAFIAAGFDEYLYQSNSLIFIEWPEVIMPLITRSACHITLEYQDEGSRLLRYKTMFKSKKCD